MNIITMNTLKPIEKILDPRYDFAWRDAEKAKNDKSLKSDFKQSAYYILGMPKSWIRGATVGALEGGLIGLLSCSFTGYSLQKSVVDGMLLGGSVGMAADIIQYTARLVYRDLAEWLRT